MSLRHSPSLSLSLTQTQTLHLFISWLLVSLRPAISPSTCASAQAGSATTGRGIASGTTPTPTLDDTPKWRRPGPKTQDAPKVQLFRQGATPSAGVMLATHAATCHARGKCSPWRRLGPRRIADWDARAQRTLLHVACSPGLRGSGTRASWVWGFVGHRVRLLAHTLVTHNSSPFGGPRVCFRVACFAAESSVRDAMARCRARACLA